MNAFQKKVAAKRKLRREWKRLAPTFESEILPVPLRKFARLQRINEVIFAPMLIDGCLATDHNGFRVYVHSDPADVSAFNEAFRAGNEAKLPNRIRFTIAHEISHTVFFKATGTGRPKEWLIVGSENAVSALEELCNEFASELLLAAPAIDRFAATYELLQPAHLRKLANQACVSPQAVFYRLRARETLLRAAGAVALVDTSSGSPIVTRFFQHSQLRAQNIFPKKIENVPLRDFIGDERLALNGGVESTVISHRPVRSISGERFVSLEIRCETIREPLSFLTVRMLECS